MQPQSPLPRVTYSNIGADFTPLHDWLDQAMPAFRAGLGKSWPNRIGGTADQAGTAYAAHSAMDRELLLGTFVDADRGAVDRAVAAARAAFPAWAGLPWRDRAAAVRAFADAVDAAKYDLAMAAMYEVGKSRLEAVGEAEEAVDLLRFYCDELARNEGYTRQMARAVPHEETVCTLRPHGVFAVIGPFNFPVALLCNMLGCIVAGNTAVLKPSPGNGLSASLLVRAAEDAGLPPGVVNLVCGADAGPLLVDAAIDGVAFTGSHEVGMEIFRKMAAGPYARPVIAEMGGKNPTYVTASADLDVAAEGVMRSAFGLQGEKCSACSVAYVTRDVHDQFLDLLRAKTEALVVGPPERRDSFVGPLIDGEALDRFEWAVAQSRADGRVVTGGDRLRGGALDRGYYVSPAVVADLPPDHELNRIEQFMPFLSVQACADLADGIARGNAIVYGLTAGIYTGDDDELRLFLDNAEAGVLYANRRSGGTTGAWPGFQTFCGWKGSGVDGKGGLGPYQLPRFMREQSHTIMHPA
ncbi:MAG: aldehyde dehydrogenase family protein [Hyphomicrobiales bacterium]|nr:aldehyde dehydrogenase family protein [Hyphomicrobiales bacterium]MCP5370194.1 aldehyde dehydrogenase family protein [Hyphomicrobiales bacterium]